MLGLGKTITKESYVSPSVAEYNSTVYLEFDGVNEYGELLTSDKETFMDAVGVTGGTMSFWVRSSDFYSSTNNQYSYMMGQYFLSFPNVKGFYIGTRNDAGTNRIFIYRADLNIMTSTFTRWSDFKTTGADHLTDDTWHHIAVVMKPFGSSWRTVLYVDGATASLTTFGGAANASNTATPAASGMNMTIARYNNIYDQFDLNEVAFWNSELSASEISYIYNQGLTGFDFTQNVGDYTSASDLYSWYQMGEKDETESIEPDSSGNSRDMTLYNTPSRLTH